MSTLRGKATALERAAEELASELAAKSQVTATTIEEAGGYRLLVTLLGLRESTASAAAVVICKLSREESEQWANAVREAGGIPPLLRLLVAGPSTSAAANAADALWRLSSSERNKDAIREAGGLPPLVALLSSSDSQAQMNATGVLRKLSKSDTNKDAIRKAGGIPALVKLLSADVSAETTAYAAGLASSLCECDANKLALLEAGGVPKLLALLSGRPVESETVKNTASALRNLSRSAACRDAIREAGGVPRLVALVAAGTDAPAARSAMEALYRMSSYSHKANRIAIFEAGSVAPLVALLTTANPISEMAKHASYVLWSQATHAPCHALLLTAVAGCASPPLAFPHIMFRLHELAEAKLAELSSPSSADLPALRRAVEQADFLQLVTPTLERCRKRLATLEADADEKRRSREALGLDKVEPPHEFVCPITFELMHDPVVASDGHSYERKSIEQVIQASGVSPLTRETLNPAILLPNRALRTCIEEHLAEQEAQALRKLAKESKPTTTASFPGGLDSSGAGAAGASVVEVLTQACVDTMWGCPAPPRPKYAPGKRSVRRRSHSCDHSCGVPTHAWPCKICMPNTSGPDGRLPPLLRRSNTVGVTP